MARKNIKVPESLFESLKDDKPDGVTWPDYLEARCLVNERDTDVSQDRGTDGIQDELEKIKRLVEQVPERTAEEFGSKYA